MGIIAGYFKNSNSLEINRKHFLLFISYFWVFLYNLVDLNLDSNLYVLNSRWRKIKRLFKGK